MKIKAVCDVTGLTDRTVRFYIEEQLIAPSYTENYLGRKSFDFSQEDIETLKNISVLRKFDFSIDEIRQIMVDINASGNVIADVMRRTEEAVSLGQEKLLALSKLNSDQTYTLQQLAEELSKPPIPLPEYKESVKWKPVKAIFSLLKALLIFVIVWSPFALSLFAIMNDIRDFYYPVIDYTAIVLTIISFWPSIGVLIVSKTARKWKKTAKRILLFLCILSIPITFLCSFGIIARSETTDIRNYRELDVHCHLNKDAFFQELFPKWPHYFVNEKQPDGSWETVYLDARYYYCMRPAMDYTYDIYAQWPLEDADFRKEVRRVKTLFEEDGDYVTVQKGNYTCLISYSGDPPFQEVTGSYTYYIFAYDEENLVVRYILCDSLEDGADQPFYLSLDW